MKCELVVRVSQFPGCVMIPSVQSDVVSPRVGSKMRFRRPSWPGTRGTARRRLAGMRQGNGTLIAQDYVAGPENSDK